MSAKEADRQQRKKGLQTNRLGIQQSKTVNPNQPKKYKENGRLRDKTDRGTINTITCVTMGQAQEVKQGMQTWKKNKTSNKKDELNIMTLSKLSSPIKWLVGV